MVESQELIKGSEEKSFREGGAAAGGRERDAMIAFSAGSCTREWLCVCTVGKPKVIAWIARGIVRNGKR